MKKWKTKKAIILGAGPAGVITGWLLSRRGWKVDILEKQKMVGGMCRSWKWNQTYFRYRATYISYFDKNYGIFWNKNFGKLLYKGKYWSKNVLKDKLYHYPLSKESINKYVSKSKN